MTTLLRSEDESTHTKMRNRAKKNRVGQYSVAHVGKRSKAPIVVDHEVGGDIDAHQSTSTATGSFRNQTLSETAVGRDHDR
jgi:hypothetical protein